MLAVVIMKAFSYTVLDHWQLLTTLSVHDKILMSIITDSRLCKQL